ncbi:MAG: hypothetical protein JSR78_10890 [Proteobacteria bacterium]|nr:hypothetical protein [Pseudomonadota bacterium]
MESALPHLRSPAAAALIPFLNPGVMLVPVPRSAPLADGALWPAKVIADILAAGGFGGAVLPCIERSSAVRKSSSSPAKERPSVAEHYESLAVPPRLIRPAQITLVDDVLTQGRTVFACAMRLAEAFPDAQIRCFAMVRTQGFVENIEQIIEPCTGVVHFYENSGKTFREP